MQVPYIAGNSAPTQLPLGRFLPPIPAGMVEKWYQANLKPDDWVLDPFGFSPMTIIEIASAGHPILAAVNNPIQAFLVKIIASAPQQGELVAALQDLATAPKGDDRMEPYIRSLYHVNCIDCRRRIEANAFLWNKGDENPFAALVECPYCGARGEQKFSVGAGPRACPRELPDGTNFGQPQGVAPTNIYQSWIIMPLPCRPGRFNNLNFSFIKFTA